MGVRTRSELLQNPTTELIPILSFNEFPRQDPHYLAI